MAMNDPAGGSTQNNNKVYDNTYYSRQKVNNLEDKLSLSFSFNRGLLIPAISTRPPYGEKIEELASVNLSQTKAGILAAKIKEFMEQPKSDITIYGVDTGISETRGFIGVQNNPDGSGKRSLLIGKIDGNGSYNGVTMNFHDDEYYYSLAIKDMESMNFSKEKVEDDYELKQFMHLLEDFSRSSNGAIAYSVADLTRYDHNRVNNTLNLIAEAMNISTKMGNTTQNTTRGSSYFDKQQGAGPNANSNRGRSEHMSADDVDNMLN